jgi:hypothetical protein
MGFASAIASASFMGNWARDTGPSRCGTTTTWAAATTSASPIGRKVLPERDDRRDTGRMGNTE